MGEKLHGSLVKILFVMICEGAKHLKFSLRTPSHEFLELGLARRCTMQTHKNNPPIGIIQQIRSSDISPEYHESIILPIPSLPVSDPMRGSGRIQPARHAGGVYRTDLYRQRQSSTAEPIVLRGQMVLDHPESPRTASRRLPPSQRDCESMPASPTP